MLTSYEGQRILLKNHWDSNRGRIHMEYLIATQRYEAQGDMDSLTRQIFEEDKLTYHTVLAQVTQNVQGAFIASNGTLKYAVSTAIEELEEAVEEFKDALN